MHKSVYDQLEMETPPKQTSRIQEYYMEECSKLAQKSSLTHKHGCIVVQNGKIIGKGYNTKHVTANSIHAEVAALYDAKKKLGVFSNKSELYVVRIGTPRHYRFKYSKPCAQCMLVIDRFHIQKVYYSVNTCYECLDSSS